MDKRTAARLALQIFKEFDKQIVEATTGTRIPPAFIAGLIANEAGKDPQGRIVRGAKRFEPGVFRKLIAVREGALRSYSGIVRADIRYAPDAAIKALATSWEATQIMGYHVIKALHCTIADLRNPDKHFFYTVKLLTLNGFPRGADNGDMAKEMRQWNTGSEWGKTYHVNYVANAEAVRSAYMELEKTRTPRGIIERVEGAVFPEPVIHISDKIDLPGSCPQCGNPNLGGRLTDELCPACGSEADAAALVAADMEPPKRSLLDKVLAFFNSLKG